MVWLVILGCRDEPQYVMLDGPESAVRASMALRGVPPSPDELRLVADSPEVLPVLIDRWLTDPRFVETMADFYGELLQVRADVIDPLPPLGPLGDYSLGEIHASLTEAPLELVRVVVRERRPLTDLLVADHTMADPIVAAVYGLEHDPAGPRWQAVTWTDGRPMAGLLSDPALWRRHESANSNFNRTRANFLADTFLCSDLASLDVAITETNLADGLEISEVLATDPSCVACHQTLDPLASHLWGLARLHRWDTVVRAYQRGCSTAEQLDEYTGNPFSQAEMCYPLETYHPEFERTWEDWALPGPSYYGQPSGSLADLGRAMAADPRFAECAARRLYGFLTRTDPSALPPETTDRFADALVTSGYDASALARAIVLSDPFLAREVAEGEAAEVAPAGVIPTRPEQLARTLEELTGTTWVVAPDPASCARRDVPTCWGEVDLLRSDRFGFRAMAGGVDGLNVVHPITTPTPVRELAWREATAEAAARVARADLAEPDRARRRLLQRVTRETVRRAEVRSQIEALVPRILGRLPADGDPVVDGLTDLWLADHARRGDTEAAWTLVLTAMLGDPWLAFH